MISHGALPRRSSGIKRICRNEKAVSYSRVVRDMILLFEFCFELAWKLMKAVLQYDGIEANSPRSCIRESWKQGLIPDAQEWLEMMEKRNLSSHTYDENAAREIYREVKGQYVVLLEAFDQLMTDWLESTEEKMRRQKYESVCPE